MAFVHKISIIPWPWWLALVAISGFGVIFGNFALIASREREAKIGKAAEALALIVPEVRKNSELARKYIEMLEGHRFPDRSLGDQAWQTIAPTGAFLALDDRLFSDFVYAYDVIKSARDVHNRLHELSYGVASALHSGPELQKRLLIVYINELKAFLSAADRILSSNAVASLKP